MIHVLSSISWTSTAQWPGPWPTGFSLRSRRLSDISVIYKVAAFGLFFQELLLLAFLWGENFCFSKGSQRGFVVLQHYLGFWCKGHLKLEAASSYSISCRAGPCIHEGKIIQCPLPYSASLPPSSRAVFCFSFSIFWLLNSYRALPGRFWGGSSLRALGSPLGHCHLLFSCPASESF